MLGLETSCDETAAAVLDGDNRILGHVILSQDVHEVYGGVVPELAARAHLQKVDSVVNEALERAGVALEDVDVFGVTTGPGLIGALLVGVCWTKAVAWALDRPWVAVHHMEGHLFGPVLEDPQAEPPFIALLVSGGHTLLLYVTAWGEYELLGKTRDDAAGEAFDKVAKLLGLPYPGGPAVQRIAEDGDPERHRLPRPMLRRNQTVEDPAFYDFSFSGLKTAVIDLTTKLGDSLSDEAPHVAAAFQDAAVDVLVSKTLRAMRETGCGRVVLGGGVSANVHLRQEMERRIQELDAETGPRSVHHASLRLSLDNGAMIARAARFRFEKGESAPLDQNAWASLDFPGLRDGSRGITLPKT
ncbi:MAG TPA: tRNA (adenosine(37)-N6)-threonylcarbamoyltransferase complex transferase subunit TsaD [Gemmatimonadetes bacterium]|nr:tRNA (adenosine(37)-N6)-threonylcarbamoyltransferase complex transferase subunit TsaD [Gemmatimonadota bacterium]HBV06804.1 tRNA (adenosine(37)-N6)-threonylcarbamoyltransferase complex transferase subunit TsaD [Gemmatimonadota bacterium]HCK59970.1 tRNA (adenosine(37)-N6)-threonylcarbamoyltransferase complex transferase subunit TsaD [Gemmatimonadota bacterium]HCW77479.1 tRNA (adenosine(37)-N6)-threonylcarbamoyltransferase complex transferase subunit TsaD [Gemmatimonadota bacterium]